MLALLFLLSVEVDQLPPHVCAGFSANLFTEFFVANSQSATLVTDAPQDLVDVVHVTWVEYWLSEIDMAEVARAVIVVTKARSALLAAVHSSHAWVMNTVRCRQLRSVVDTLIVVDLGDTHSGDLLLGENTETHKQRVLGWDAGVLNWLPGTAWHIYYNSATF